MTPRLPSALVALCLLTSAASASHFPPNFDDAPLHAVTFVDVTEGWAVGEHGVIWHTIDGGKQWERQKSGTRASLRAVQFLTPYLGFAVGRSELPENLGRSTGVVLATTDGGLTWTERTSGTLPGLVTAKFFDDKNAIVAGDSTPAFPCGMFTTRDGGQTWTPLDGPTGIDWAAASVRDPAMGTFVGGGTVAGIVGGKPAVRTKVKDTVVTCVATGNGFAVVGTAAGSLMTSTDEGANWSLTMPLPPELVTGFSAACAVGDHAWVCTRSGGLCLTTSDKGKTWSCHSTGCPCPVNAITMLDANSGWAVGELGTILKTTDGGQTWAIQRTGGQRCGVVFIHEHGTAVPFDTLAMLGAKDGHLCGVIQVGSAVNAERLLAVTRACGGATAETLGMKANDPELVRQLVQRIRQWRPESVVTDRDGPFATLVAEAVQKAAEPAAFTDQINTMKFAAHATKAVFAVHATTDKAAVQFDYSKLVPELADDVRDFCDTATTLFGPAGACPQYRFYARLDSGPATSVLVNESLLPRGGTGRRKVLPPTWPADYLAAKEKIAEARRKIDAVVADPARAGGPEKALEQIRNGLVGIPEDMAAHTAGRVTAALARTGHWGMAREMAGFVVESFESYPEAAEAARWLLTFHTSAEVRRRIELGHVSPLPKTVFDTVDDMGAVKAASHVETGPGVVKPVYRFKTGEAARTWNRFAIDLEPKLVAFGPGLANDPAVVRARVLARERAGINVTSPDRPAAKTMDVFTTPSKPHLDGQFDDECWRACDTITMGDAFRTDVKVCRDERFLYLAITATHPAGKSVAKVETRTRDTDLAAHDRVEFALDLDRDGATAFRFGIDQRGALTESCWGDRGWDPKWFVGFESTETGWTAEAAIPLGELTGSSVAGATWGVECVRVTPGGGESRLVPPGERAALRFVK
jgi:photosystem II stability/assembly factor-like uncharacterized protein